MHISVVFSKYVGRQFLTWFGVMMLALLGVIALFDLIEQIRRVSGNPDAGFGLVFTMSLLKLPYLAEQAVPFAILFGAMFAFWRLNRSHELVVIRAAGVSAWQFLLPVLFLAAAIGLFKVLVFHQIASTLLLQYEQLEARHIKGTSSLAALSRDGLWLRQSTDEGNYILYAQRVSPRDMRLNRVIVFLMRDGDRFAGRIDAATARLENGYWALEDARVSGPTAGTSRRVADYRIVTNMTPENIQDSFAPPETMSFWELPRFIAVLQKAGFSALRHQIYWQSQLAEPLLLAALVLLAAAFSLRPVRRGRTGLMIVTGIGVAFLLFFMSDVVYALGVSARIPVLLSAWSPSVISALLGTTMLFHLEDG
jgi:lipopolysaccharide export system permease protein